MKDKQTRTDLQQLTHGELLRLAIDHACPCYSSEILHQENFEGPWSQDDLIDTVMTDGKSLHDQDDYPWLADIEKDASLLECPHLRAHWDSLRKPSVAA